MKKEERTEAAAKTSRRRFTKSLAAAVVAAPVAVVAAQERPAAPKESKAPPGPQPTPTPQQPPPSPVAEAYEAVARARFGEHISAEEFERVRRDLGGNVRAAKALGDFKLKNSDEPDFVFGA